MIKYSKKLDRAIDTATGRFVKFSIARRSSVFRQQYEPFMISKKLSKFSKGEIEFEELIRQLEERKVPKKKWKLIVPEPKKLSPLMMYVETQGNMSKRAYQKMCQEISSKRGSNRKRRSLEKYYIQVMGKMQTTGKKYSIKNGKR